MGLCEEWTAQDLLVPLVDDIKEGRVILRGEKILIPDSLGARHALAAHQPRRGPARHGEGDLRSPLRADLPGLPPLLQGGGAAEDPPRADEDA